MARLRAFTPHAIMPDARAPRVGRNGQVVRRRRRQRWSRRPRQPTTFVVDPVVHQGLYLCDRRNQPGQYQYLMAWATQRGVRRQYTWEPVATLMEDNWQVEIINVDLWVQLGRPRTFLQWATDEGLM
jgi:hypothetical protein